jgi:hypothetical protein
VFIVGNPRSGTTFLHRLLAKDREHFTTMKMWEMLLAPSISQRRMFKVLAALDRLLGYPVQRRLAGHEARWHEEHVSHRVSFYEPEEDDYLLLHIWSALTAWLSVGAFEEAEPYTYFDTDVPRGDRERIMNFYLQCVQRHVRAHSQAGQGDGQHYLAKNPAMTPKLETVIEWFPDAKVINLVRNPLQAIPSYVSLMQFTYNVLDIPVPMRDLNAYILEMARHWYDYALAQLDDRSTDRALTVRYDDLVADPEGTVSEIYDSFGFPLSTGFGRVLQAEAEESRQYRSRHEYSLEAFGLSRARILDEYEEVFQRFGFDMEEPCNKSKRCSR